jgi:hypothetical protein
MMLGPFQDTLYPVVFEYVCVYLYERMLAVRWWWSRRVHLNEKGFMKMGEETTLSSYHLSLGRRPWPCQFLDWKKSVKSLDTCRGVPGTWGRYGKSPSRLIGTVWKEPSCPLLTVLVYSLSETPKVNSIYNFCYYHYIFSKEISKKETSGAPSATGWYWQVVEYLPLWYSTNVRVHDNNNILYRWVCMKVNQHRGVGGRKRLAVRQPMVQVDQWLESKFRGLSATIHNTSANWPSNKNLALELPSRNILCVLYNYEV